MTNVRKKYRIDFYSIECENGEFIDFVNKKNKKSFLRKKLNHLPYEIILDVFEDSTAYLTGNFIKVRMDDIDPKFNVSTFQTGELPLSEDEGLPKGSVFLYLKRQKILFFQTTKSGLTSSEFCQYFEANTQTGNIRLGYILSEEGFKRLAGLTHISKIDISIKGLDRGYILEGTGNAKSVMKTFKELNPSNLKIEVSKGHRANGLSLNNVRSLVKGFYNMMAVGSANEEENGYIKITGREADDDNLKAIDLIITRYRRFIEINFSSDSRLNNNLYTHEKIEALKDLVNQVSKDLNKLFNEKV